MSEYTEQEIEMLARFDAEREGFEWAALSPGARETNLDVIGKSLRYEIADVQFVRVIRAVARLMREAREQGAAVMRERAAVRVFDDFSALESFDRDTATDLRDSVRRLPLKAPS